MTLELDTKYYYNFTEKFRKVTATSGGNREEIQQVF